MDRMSDSAPLYALYIVLIFVGVIAAGLFMLFH
jgi:hypothetical protein